MLRWQEGGGAHQLAASSSRPMQKSPLCRRQASFSSSTIATVLGMQLRSTRAFSAIPVSAHFCECWRRPATSASISSGLVSGSGEGVAEGYTVAGEMTDLSVRAGQISAPSIIYLELQSAPLSGCWESGRISKMVPKTRLQSARGWAWRHKRCGFRIRPGEMQGLSLRRPSPPMQTADLVEAILTARWAQTWLR